MEKNKSKVKRYTSFTYENKVYVSGDLVPVINRTAEDYYYICKIKELLLLETSPNKHLPVILVQW